MDLDLYLIPLCTHSHAICYSLGMVYYIQAASGPIKIGYTRALESLPARSKSLQTGNHEDLELIGYQESGQIPHEKRLHWKFRTSWVRGEWFRPVGLLLEAANLCTPGEVFQALRGYESEDAEYEVEYSEAKENTRARLCPACNRMVNRGDAMARVGVCWVHLECAEDPPVLEFMPGTQTVRITKPPKPRKPRRAAPRGKSERRSRVDLELALRKI